MTNEERAPAPFSPAPPLATNDAPLSYFIFTRRSCDDCRRLPRKCEAALVFATNDICHMTAVRAGCML
ncbi:MAG TPA: hypothetical protein PLR07_12835, partial [Promineifilum sp.]|nr:hypothetical protein [Promineifilum sp.]